MNAVVFSSSNSSAAKELGRRRGCTWPHMLSLRTEMWKPQHYTITQSRPPIQSLQKVKRGLEIVGWYMTMSNLHLHLPFNRRGRWITTDDFTTSFLHFQSVLHCPLGLGELQACPFPDVMVSSHLYFCLSCLLSPVTVPCKTVFARPDEQRPTVIFKDSFGTTNSLGDASVDRNGQAGTLSGKSKYHKWFESWKRA